MGSTNGSEEMAVVLTWLRSELEADRADSSGVLDDARTNAARIDALDGRIEELPRSVCSPVDSRAARVRPQSPMGPSRPRITLQDWSTVVERARQRLEGRGTAANACTLDKLLDRDEVERIQRRFSGSFSLDTRLDRYDIASTVAAGLVAAAVDFLIVRIPRDVVYLGQFHQSGSPMTEWVRSLKVPEDNWLARHFKTAYDEVAKVQAHIPGFGPKTHRLQTFGHDPLLGLIMGTIDIMRGGLTAVSEGGKVLAFPGTGVPDYNPLTAFVWQVMHLLSDGFTRMGLPVPGWSLLQLFQLGSFGEKERTVADLARFMYLKGYDSRHFLTMSTSVTAAEVVLRGYFSIRQKLDRDYRSVASREAEIVGSERVSDHPRYQALALAAHGLAAGANAGKVAVYAGNPLAVNYAQWLRFFSALFQWMRSSLRSPSHLLRGYARANWEDLERGWPELDVRSPTFPTLVIAVPGPGGVSESSC